MIIAHILPGLIICFDFFYTVNQSKGVAAFSFFLTTFVTFPTSKVLPDRYHSQVLSSTLLQVGLALSPLPSEVGVRLSSSVAQVPHCWLWRW